MSFEFLAQQIEKGDPTYQRNLKAEREAKIAESDLAREKNVLSLADYKSVEQDPAIASTLQQASLGTGPSTLSQAVNQNVLASQGVGSPAAQQKTQPPPGSIAAIATGNTPESAKMEQNTAPITTSPDGTVSASTALIKAASDPSASPSLKGVAEIASRDSTPVSDATGQVIPSKVELVQLAQNVSTLEKKAEESSRLAKLMPLKFGDQALRDQAAVVEAKQKALTAQARQQNGTYQVMSQALKAIEDGTATPDQAITAMQTLGKQQLLHEKMHDPKNANRNPKDVEAEVDKELEAGKPPKDPLALRMWLSQHMAQLKDNEDTIGVQKEIVNQQHVRAQTGEQLAKAKQLASQSNLENAQAKHLGEETRSSKEASKLPAQLKSALSEADTNIGKITTTQIENEKLLTKMQEDLSKLPPAPTPSWYNKSPEDPFKAEREGLQTRIQMRQTDIDNGDKDLKEFRKNRKTYSDTLENLLVPKSGGKHIQNTQEVTSSAVPTTKAAGLSADELIAQVRSTYPEAKNKSDGEITDALIESGHLSKITGAPKPSVKYEVERGGGSIEIKTNQYGQPDFSLSFKAALDSGMDSKYANSALYATGKFK